MGSYCKLSNWDLVFLFLLWTCLCLWGCLLVTVVRSLFVSVVCLLFVVPCQTVCSECAFPVCGTNVTFVLVRVVDCFFCLSDRYSVVKLQSALTGAIQKSSILITLPAYSSCAFLSVPFRLFLREAPT